MEKEIVETYSPPAFSPDGFSDSSDFEVQDQVDNPAADSEYEESGQVPQSVDQPKRVSRKKRVSSDRRFDQLVYERGMLEQQNVFKDSVIADQQRQLQEFQEKLQHKQKESNDYFESALQERELLIKREIKRAKEEGDVDTEIALIDELAEIKAKKSSNSLRQYSLHEKQLEQAQRINEEPYVPLETMVSPIQPRANEVVEQWIEDNPWYDESPRLRQEADQIIQDLSDRLTFNHQKDMVGTPEFFQSVANIMNNRYGLDQKPSRQSEQVFEEEDQDYSPDYSPQSNPITPVAPVTRKAMTMADQYVQNSSPYGTKNQQLRALTKEEFAIARHLPTRKKGEGELDLIKRYSQAKNYPKSPFEGGTPYRLTIAY